MTKQNPAQDVPKAPDICPCGFPQSYPIPHEHDRTDREKQIIDHYTAIIAQLRLDREAAGRILDYLIEKNSLHSLDHAGYPVGITLSNEDWIIVKDMFHSILALQSEGK